MSATATTDPTTGPAIQALLWDDGPPLGGGEEVELLTGDPEDDDPEDVTLRNDELLLWLDVVGDGTSGISASEESTTTVLTSEVLALSEDIS